MAEVVAIQLSAIVDHVSMVNDAAAAAAVGASEVGGARRCSVEELNALMNKFPGISTRAGGSAANVARTLASGFGVKVQLVGPRGADEFGAMFVKSLEAASVDTSRVRVLPGATGRCMVLTCSGTGQRTMRTAMSSECILRADMLEEGDLKGAKWVFLSAYSAFEPDLLAASARLAKGSGVRVMLDLASWETVKANLQGLRDLLAEGLVDCCVCNEDEAKQILPATEQQWSPEATLQWLLQYCEFAVVTLGSKGCMAAGRGKGPLPESCSEPAVAGIKALDGTGAGDAFSSGFLYGLLRGLPLQKCASIGCLVGAAAVQAVGADLGPRQLQWLHQRMHSELAASVVESSALEIYKELLDAYALVARIGVGAVYFGSSRLTEASPYWTSTVELSRAVAKLLEVPTWTGGGPGIERAASEGARAAGLPVGAIRISREAGQAQVLLEDYLPAEDSVLCKHMPTRKAALTDAGVRLLERHRTAYIFLPGGLGTLDELFAILTLLRLNKLGSHFPVPLIVVNYNGFYDGLMGLLEEFDSAKVMDPKTELHGLVLARTNQEVLDYLGHFYLLKVPAASARA